MVVSPLSKDSIVTRHSSSILTDNKHKSQSDLPGMARNTISHNTARVNASKDDGAEGETQVDVMEY